MLAYRCKNRLVKKELLTHIPFMIAFLAISAIFQGWLTIEHWPILIGGFLGTVLPDIDNLIASQFLGSGISPIFKDKSVRLKDKIAEAVRIMYIPRSETQNLIFHNAQFQLVFVVFAFLLATSSSSLFGIGIVLAFLLHMVVDEVADFMDRGNIDKWFTDFPIPTDSKKRFWFLVANLVVVISLGFFI